MIEEIENYAKALSASDEVMSWIGTTGKKVATKAFQGLANYGERVSDLEHIVDYFVSGAAPTRLKKMSFEDAKRKATEWSEANQKKGRGLIDTDADIETIYDFKDGRKIVRLKTKEALQREGFLMSHCVGGYSLSSDCHIYSYRDENNMPHATFEVRKNNEEIVQIKGKGNGPIHPKYIHPILAFLEAIGMKIRPQDMVNLGYHHINKCHLDFLKKLPGAMEQVAEIGGEFYAY